LTSSNTAWATSFAYANAGGGAGASNTYNGGNGGSSAIKTRQLWQ
jgi:hypothetical protein